MAIGICVFELHLPEARSLKQKRKVIKGLIERLHARLRVSIAETGFHDKHQRSELTLALVTRDEREADRLLDSVRSLVEEQLDAIVTSWDPQLLGES